MNATSGGATTQHALEAITLQNKINSPLLRLPAEIRNQIYVYVLYDGNITVCLDDLCIFIQKRFINDRTTHAHFPARLLRLLEASQHIYAEARLLVFSLNPISILFMACISQFLEDDWLDPSQYAAIKRVDISTCILIHCHREACTSDKLYGALRDDLKCLEGLSGLKKVVVQFDKYKGCSVHDTCEARYKQEIEEAVKRDERTIKMEYQDMVL